MTDRMSDPARMSPITGKPCGAGGCTGTSKRTGLLCGAPAVSGTDRCSKHAGRSRAAHKAKGQVVVELRRWGLDQAELADPGEVLLRLVTQSAARCELYGRLLGEAYDAAERLRAAGDTPDHLFDGERGSGADSGAPGSDADTAARDLERVLATGGVGVLIGHTYSAVKDIGVVAAGEAIRGLVQLEAAERDRCANFATKAIAAGLAERQVRLAERQGALMVRAVEQLLDSLGLSEAQRALVPAAAEAAFRAIGIEAA